MPDPGVSVVSGQSASSMPSTRPQGVQDKPPPSPGSTTGSSFEVVQSTAVEKAVAAAAAAAAPLKEGAEGQPETKGWLYKWTNYIKGYQKRWFVLANGLLHYYRNQAEMARTCRGSISLHNGHIYTEDSCNFVVSNAGGTQTYHLRAASEVERQHWVTVLELAKTKALQRMVSEDPDHDDGDGSPGGDIDKQELTSVVKFLSTKLQDLRTCHQLVDKHRHALQHSLSELELSGNISGQNSTPNKDSNSIKDLGIKIKTVNERATLLNITCNAMINASSEFLEQCQNNGKRWHRILENEREIRQNLENMVQQLAKQHSHLELMVKKEHEEQNTSTINTNSIQIGSEDNSKDDKKDTLDRSGSALGSANASIPHIGVRSVSSNYSGTDSGDDDEFEDAIDEQPICFNVPVPPIRMRKSSSEESLDSSCDEPHQVGSYEDTFNVVQRKSNVEVPDGGAGDKNQKTTDVSKNNSSQMLNIQEEKSPNKMKSGVIRQRRTTVPEKPNISFSLWSIMKNCIGKDLSKIPVPVNFSEPTSMLQRLVEDFEYSEILDKAAQCNEDCEQLAYVAAFTVSAYSTTAIRTGKPFNPLLGETYECDRTEDKHFRCFSEQVTHHPPMVAQYCESSHPDCKPGEAWKCWQEFTMRSRFRGKYLEVEPLGIAHLVFPKTGNHYTWRKVKTVVHNIVVGRLWIDQHGEMEVINHFTGDKCHMKFEPYSYFAGVAKKVTGTITSKNGKVEWVLNGTWDSRIEGSRVIGESKSKGKSNLEIENSKVLWKANPPYPGSDKFYNLSQFACELNEEEDGVSPTDTRLRPDQRLMEIGEWDEANTEKVRLEDKQRSVRRQRENEAEKAAQEGRTYEGYQPKWFQKVKDQQNGEKIIHMYTGGYWEAKENQNWGNYPDIF